MIGLPNADVRVHLLDDTPDEHGWVGDAWQALPVWEGQANAQEAAPVASGAASEPGGAGPGDPAVTRTTVFYLPDSCPVVPGSAIIHRGSRWVVGEVQHAIDPTGGTLSSVAATARADTGWPV